MGYFLIKRSEITVVSRWQTLSLTNIESFLMISETITIALTAIILYCVLRPGQYYKIKEKKLAIRGDTVTTLCRLYHCLSREPKTWKWFKLTKGFRKETGYITNIQKEIVSYRVQIKCLKDITPIKIF